MGNEVKSPRDNLIGQKEYNSKTSKKFKKLYYSFEIISMILGTAVPIVLLIDNISPIIPAIISGCSVLLHSISSFAGFQKKWINCRNLTEQLKSELRKYDCGIKEYESTDQKDMILAERLETIVASGNDFWIQVVSEKKEDDK
ncbi:DUF4231 domain-containing protein [Treponema sp.]|uniref:DUF4231 domain-containing protein n=1 Tax=Treponema sp. TaxID=166 RepID=UPI00298E6D9E|nr:DUF4231 domain-containing protein [Treponema sp.]MDD7459551.1 DUF4231 domain-containing protein [Spirochaetales bacterium]MDD7610433.1 DUF4231 domain-containing protein [Spirochaetales bacterium]